MAKKKVKKAAAKKAAKKVAPKKVRAQRLPKVETPKLPVVDKTSGYGEMRKLNPIERRDVRREFAELIKAERNPAQRNTLRREMRVALKDSIPA